MKPKFRHKQTVSLKIGNLGTTVCPSKEKVATQTFMASDQHVTPSYVLDSHLQASRSIHHIFMFH